MPLSLPQNRAIMPIMKRFIRKYFPSHFHVVLVKGMAVGVQTDNNTITVTGWRWECCLCGQEIEEITESGIEQLSNGIKKDLVLQWNL